MRKFTDIFIERPVLATVVSLTLLVLGLQCQPVRVLGHLGGEVAGEGDGDAGLAQAGAEQLRVDGVVRTELRCAHDMLPKSLC